MILTKDHTPSSFALGTTNSISELAQMVGGAVGSPFIRYVMRATPSGHTIHLMSKQAPCSPSQAPEPSLEAICGSSSYAYSQYWAISALVELRNIAMSNQLNSNILEVYFLSQDVYGGHMYKEV